MKKTFPLDSRLTGVDDMRVFDLDCLTERQQSILIWVLNQGSIGVSVDAGERYDSPVKTRETLEALVKKGVLNTVDRDGGPLLRVQHGVEPVKRTYYVPTLGLQDAWKTKEAKRQARQRADREARQAAEAQSFRTRQAVVLAKDALVHKYPEEFDALFEKHLAALAEPVERPRVTAEHVRFPV